MMKQKLAGFAAAGAIAALFAATAAQAQTMMVPQPMPDRVDVYTNGPQADPGDNPANWSAQRNVVESQRYEQMTHTNASFRASRIRKECGPITEPSLYQQCVGTFR